MRLWPVKITAHLRGCRSSTTTSSARRPAAAASAPRTTSRQAATGGAASAALQAKNTELLETVQGLERERDFYFSKLRDIELLIQQAMEADPVLEEDEGSLLKQIQTILYSTEVSGSQEPTIHPDQWLTILAGGLRDSPRGRW